MPIHKPKHILIAPLDWGLGHTARCLPLIRCLLELGHIPVFAGNVSQRSFIDGIFRGIEKIHLDGYDVSYSGWNRVAQAGLLSQLPRIMKSISAENKWLQNLCRERQMDGVISDNRYGLHHPHVPSVIISHQLQVLSGVGGMADRAVQKMHYKFLDRFQHTWVPDVAGADNLAGSLSHCAALPKSTKYIGLLSQFAGMGVVAGEEHLLILLSGPEPQRSILSRLLWKEAVGHEGKVVFVEGSVLADVPRDIPSHITHYKRLTTDALLPLLQQAVMVVCRSGYSTLMDLVALRKKAIIIPTPAQTEQQYLGRHLHDRGVFMCSRQDGFSLKDALVAARAFPWRGHILSGYFEGHKEVVREWVEDLTPALSAGGEGDMK